MQEVISFENIKENLRVALGSILLLIAAITTFLFTIQILTPIPMPVIIMNVGVMIFLTVIVAVLLNYFHIDPLAPLKEEIEPNLWFLRTLVLSLFIITLFVYVNIPDFQDASAIYLFMLIYIAAMSKANMRILGKIDTSFGFGIFIFIVGSFTSSQFTGFIPPASIPALATVEQRMLLFVFIVFVAPIAEELLFRGFIIKTLSQKCAVLSAIIFSAFTFSLMHAYVYRLSPLTLFYLFALGLACGFLVVKSKSLIPAIVLHMINNALAFMKLVLIT